MKKLTKKQAVFVEEYLVDLNATQAAIRAGYSAKTADKIATQLLGKTLVAEAIAARMKDREARTQITQDKVLREIARIALADPRKVMTWGPKGVDLVACDQLSEDDAAIIGEVSESFTENGRTLKVKLNDKLRALDMLGRHLGLFKEKIELSGTVKTQPVPADLSQLSDDELQSIASIALKLAATSGGAGDGGAGEASAGLVPNSTT
ncbi:terminase small subunit [Trinickia mobilis]|uniref:terminase small subunit n=1 Tax=Trinickia mobilis TaxID=2816356 RepID=UPI001A902CA8|nr:terminase small subunit [Trinickia mobilis]